MKIDVYCISNEGSVINYGHFMFAVLIPLLSYDLVALAAGRFPATYNIKINVGPLFRILADLFGDRVVRDYVAAPDMLSDRQNYYDLYLKLLARPPKSGVLLPAFDIFNDSIYKLVLHTKINVREYERLQRAYVAGGTNISRAQRMRYKRLYITDMYQKLKAARPKVLSFFDYIAPTFHIAPIVVIERRRPELADIADSLVLNAGGARRVIANHTEMVAAITREFGEDNVANLCMENYTLCEQFRIFSEAKVVVAQHGAALSNIIFCGPHTTVVEINPELGENNWHSNLAEFCSVKYVQVLQPAMTRGDWNEMFGTETDNGTDISSIIAKMYTAEMQYHPLAAFMRNSGRVDVAAVLDAIHDAIRDVV